MGSSEPVFIECGVCGSRSFQTPPTEASPEAIPDFDTRPKHHSFDPVSTWVAECPNCGYCSADLTAAPAGTAEILATEEYGSRLRKAELPVVARRFAAYSLLLERSHFWSDAGWLWLHAAWACDDSGDVEGATECRLTAVDRWKRGKELGQGFAEELGSEFALVTDVFRRSGRFEDATVACTEGLDIEDIPPAVEKMLRRQMTLVQARDTAAHSMSELLDKEN